MIKFQAEQPSLPVPNAALDDVDCHLEQMACARLAANPLVHERNVNTSVCQRIAILSGSVPTYAEKNEAEATVRAIKGIFRVENQTIVDVPVPANDADLLHAIAELFAHYDRIDSSDIEVETSDGAVVLRGTVQVAGDDRRLMRLIRTTPTVKGVRSELVLARSHDPADCELGHAIARALDAAVGLDAAQIRVAVRRGKVRLDGVLDSDADVKCAEDLVKQLPGVVQLTSKLRRVENGLSSESDPYGHFVGHIRQQS